MNSKRILIVYDEPGVPHGVAIRHETCLACAIVQPTQGITPPTTGTTLIANPLLDAQETAFTPPAGHVPCSLTTSDKRAAFYYPPAEPKDEAHENRRSHHKLAGD